MYVGDSTCVGTLYLCFPHSWSGTGEHYLQFGDSGDGIYCVTGNNSS